MAKSIAERLKARGPISPDAWKKAFATTKAGSDPDEDDESVIYGDVTVVRQTELALLVRGPLAEDVWVPKSVTLLEGSRLSVKRWWAKKEGWL